MSNTAKVIHKSHGAISNPHNRFHKTVIEKIDDGWQHQHEHEKIPALNIETMVDHSKTIISKNNSPDLPFSQSINPYRGCEHGCIYCFARPSHAYWDLSPGLDFETKLFYKPKAATLLEDALNKKKYDCQTIVIGANTDPYQPIEKKLKITQQLLNTLEKYHHPFSIITKSNLILRDKAILERMAGNHLASASISITTLDNDLKRRLEPRAASPEARLKTVKELSKAGVPVSVLMAPIIPFINDHEIESIVKASAEAGAHSIAYIFIRLPLEINGLFEEWLQAHYPDRAKRVMEMIKQSRRGKAYVSHFGERMVGVGPYADMIVKRFNLACKKHNITKGEIIQLDTTQFFVPNTHKYQIALL